MIHEPAAIKFAADPWRITEEGFSPEDLAEHESVFALGNGYIGLRGSLEEHAVVEGSYLNGVYESKPILYGEACYGYAKNSQTICNVADAKSLLLRADGELFDPTACKVRDHCRTLDLREGVLVRSFTWETAGGCVLEVELRRLVSLTALHQAAALCTVRAVRGGCMLELTGGVRPSREVEGDPDDPRVASGTEEPLRVLENGADVRGLWFVQATRATGMAVACAVAHNWSGVSEHGDEERGEGGVSHTFSARLEQGEEVRLETHIAYCSGALPDAGSLREQARAHAERGARDGWSAMAAEQRNALGAFWDNAGIEISGDDATLQGLRFNMFHLLQAAGRDGRTNVPAKGLTGRGYEGHYFWDTEAYILPFFLHTEPQVARALLAYRYRTLDKARERARTMGHKKGALYPWRTIGGEECSAYYPAGTAQYHIDADVAYAVQSYITATGDTAFLAEMGAEILAETARMWVDHGFYNPAREGRFCIHCVTGPDEYTALVDNNVYTNLMAKENLLAAAEALDWLAQTHPSRLAELIDKLRLETDEPASWRMAAERMYLPRATDEAVIPQDDGFLLREPWPLADTPEENFPLLLHFHPLVIYRHQVCKQADLILAMVVLGEQFSIEQKRANFHYYDGVTTHDSSLSAAVFSILAGEIGERDTAYRYFKATARLDLDNMHRNTKDGLHMANMAGTWLCLAKGFAGMRCVDGVLSFRPWLPEEWQGYRLRVQFLGRTIEVAVDGAGASYQLVYGEPMVILADGEDLQLA